MTLDDLKDQLSSLIKKVTDRIHDLEQFQKLEERFYQLPARIQIVLLYVGSAFVVFILFLIPFSTFQDSRTSLEDFKSHRQLIRSLNELKGTGNLSAYFQQPPAQEFLKSNIETQLNSLSLVKNIQGPMFEPSSTENSSLISPNQMQDSLWVNLKKLTLNQVIDIGFKLQNIHSSSKLKNLKIVLNQEDARYLDASYEIITFHIPSVSNSNSSAGDKE